MKLLIIQTAFIGDVILATALIEKLKVHYSNAQIDILVRKGNEGLLLGNPNIHRCMVFDKSNGKYKHLFRIIKEIRNVKYDYVVNAQRFFTTGLITTLSGAKHTVGYDKNPLSLFFTSKIKHEIGDNNGVAKHEVERNQQLIEQLTDQKSARPKVYPSEEDYRHVDQYKMDPYICVAPTSVWYTKQFPAARWIEFLDKLDDALKVYLLGAPDDQIACEDIKNKTKHPRVENLAGKLSLLASAALMKDSKMNYVNDSAPMHLASAMNAPVCAVYCSTVPSFGFGPLSDASHVVEVSDPLSCRPCGLHGHKACPQGHFNCAQLIELNKMLTIIDHRQ